MIHNLVGILSYPAAIWGLWQMAQSFRGREDWRKLSRLTMTCALTIAGGFGLMLIPDLAPWRGLSQRMAEIAGFCWIVGISVTLCNMSRSSEPG